MEPSKRELRQQKREIKRAGGKRRRRLGKQALADHPDEATSLDEGFDFGRNRSARLNGMDRDPTRQRPGRESGPRSPEINNEVEESAGRPNPA